MTSAHTPVLFALLTAILFTGCDDAFIDPYVNEEEYYTVYGFLNMDRNFQFGAKHSIRVSAITRRPQDISRPEDLQADLDARVFLTNLATNQTYELLHNLVELEQGKWGHVFETSFPVQPADRYLLEVKRTDGATTSAVTEIPNITGVIVESEPFIEDTDTGNITQTHLLKYIQAIWEPKAIYHIGSGGSCIRPAIYNIPYQDRLVRETDGLIVNFTISADINEIKAQSNSENITLCRMGIKGLLLSNDWIVPGDDVDINELSLPQHLDNIENGYGFFGSLGLFQNDWEIRGELREKF